MKTVKRHYVNNMHLFTIIFCKCANSTAVNPCAKFYADTFFLIFDITSFFFLQNLEILCETGSMLPPWHRPEQGCLTNTLLCKAKQIAITHFDSVFISALWSYSVHSGKVTNSYRHHRIMIYVLCEVVQSNLTHWGRAKMAAIFQTTFSNGFSWMKMYQFRLIFHSSLFSMFQLTIFQHWFR